MSAPPTLNATSPTRNTNRVTRFLTALIFLLFSFIGPTNAESPGSSSWNPLRLHQQSRALRTQLDQFETDLRQFPAPNVT
ncbi:hypothetical protein FEM03_20065 [Phragmitibacter flavus]|uniref:Uncharacterized protein n=1 Tax=Phragmitibacter flavus TaxID=2576071 RepID=A0A5R8KBM6_9BACT|nr:hypothetical protein [Phragmitibacter flavus]TLD68959.1 hypothetical protein FEM03_20065 [Phragmitibacter flavus]